ncbi:helix-turn-helix domain-containing protein [Umezawaea sp. Da 62-37]|uniref:ArsR/SmtB family transcription factor n=1 Tax=Umezawaea sp. Da 62-37 TaxID=3075927 RepID=UPI0028F6DCF7|nr:helix-turn-helix domain-containing protein [Umezawaea sp. Da 62-37]WNV82834.1 helix-turn-helix domain-containing protein [Umezawaea sp. Da 62-37]
MSFERRQLTDAHDLRALSHPLRVRIMELLAQEGPLTATAAGAELGTTASNCSFHLRLLARHGFVEEAEGGVGRQRPWRLVEQETRIRSKDLDQEGLSALRAIDELRWLRRRHQHSEWWRTRDEYPVEWRDAAAENFAVLHLTAAELAELNEAVHEVISRYVDRGLVSNRRPGTTPVDISTSTIPLRLPRPGGKHG